MKSNAKINLGLKIISKSESGMHNIQTVMLPISLCDRIKLKLNKSNDIIIKTSDKRLDNESNICYKAALLLKEKYNIQKGFKIYINKKIPLEAGLGGGSSNAAVVIKLISKKCKLNLSNKEMIEVARQLGSDVPFFVLNKPAYVCGQGEIVNQIKTSFKSYVLLVKPKKGLSTKFVYQQFDLNNKQTLQEYKVCDKLLNNEQPYSYIFNDLEDPAKQLNSEILTLLEKLRKEETLYSGLSGSGSCCYALFENKKSAKKAYKKLKSEYFFVQIVQIINKD